MTTKICPSDWAGMVKWMEEQGESWQLVPCSVMPGFLAFVRIRKEHLVENYWWQRRRMGSFNPALLNDIPNPLDHIAGEIAQGFNKHIQK